MKENIDFDRLVCCILPGVIYVTVSALLPDFSHTLTAISIALLFLTLYYLLPQRLTVLKRCLISSAAVIVIACAVRFGISL